MRFSLEWLRDHVEIDLPPEALARSLTAAGFAVETIEPFGDDHVFEIEITGNRPDCMNHRGLAREIAAFSGRPLLPLDLSLAESPRKTDSAAAVRIEDPDLCCRYVARVVRGVKVGPSPAWLERRLRAIGLVPRSNVVDASNLVLFDLGHPLHTFDLSRLAGPEIVVRRARPGERLLTVADGLDHPLDPSMLVIADAQRPVAVAGVMGGLESGITDATRDVLVESAWFDPVTVRRTARALGMRTDASHRFERGADPAIPPAAAARLCRLIVEVAGGECLGGALDALARPQPLRTVNLRSERLGDVLGAPVGAETIESRLRALEIGLDRQADGGTRPPRWRATIPSHRSDLLAEEDLIEEVARSVGYDSFPSTLPSGPTLPPERLARDDADAEVRQLLAGLGYFETIGYAMVGRGEDALFAPQGAGEPFALTNPLSDRWEVMRRSLLPGLVRAAGHNLRRGQRDIALFEVGTIFHRSAGDGAPLEQRAVGLLGCGRAGGVRWNIPAREMDVYDVTAAMEAIAAAFRVEAPAVVPAQMDFLHPGQAFTLRLDGRVAGFGGVVHPEIAERFDLPRGCVLGQLALTLLLARRGGPVRFRPLPRFPSASRDVSAVVSASTSYDEIARIAREALAGAPARVTLVDRYTGPPLPEDRVSLTLNILIEPEDRTWTIEEIDALVGRLVEALRARAGAGIRT